GAVVDGGLRDGAEEGRAHALRGGQAGKKARDDLEGGEARELAVGGDGGEGLVGGGDEALGEGDAFGLEGVEDGRGRAIAKNGGELPGDVHGVADAGVHALPADGRVDVRGVAEEEDAAAAEVFGDAMVHAVAGEPIDVLDVDVDPIEDVLGDVVPGELVVLSCGLVGEVIA